MNRIQYLDSLRLFAILGVIHVHSTYKFDLSSCYQDWLCSCVRDCAPRWIIPVFVMLSGVFMLNPKKVITLKENFTLRIPRFLIAYVSWWLIYCLYKVGIGVVTNNLKISIFGESHGKSIGALIDNLPAGEKIDFEEILRDMKRRAPGNYNFSTDRKEEDIPEILSGISNGCTTGAPVCAIISNKNYNSKDYENILEKLRPGHADYTANMRYNGFNDVAGGGHLSGRLTAPLVFCGALCKQILKRRGVLIGAHISSIGKVTDDKFNTNIEKSLLDKLSKSEGLTLINDSLYKDFYNEIMSYKNAGDSIGGTVECAIIGVPGGIGDPMFYGVENIISSLVFSIPGIKGIEFGNGFDCSKISGSENNDEFFIEKNSIFTKTNNHGGILGGISSGMPIVFRVAVKPTPSIKKEQSTVNIKYLKSEKISVVGRHDPCIVPRVVPCVEAVAAIAILDLMLGEGKI